MEMKEELIIAAVEKKPIETTKGFIQNVLKKETVRPEINADKKPVITPAPFYDELHFGDYE